MEVNHKAFELAAAVAKLLATKAWKKEANEDFDVQIKALKKSIARLSAEIEEQRK